MCYPCSPSQWLIRIPDPQFPVAATLCSLCLGCHMFIVVVVWTKLFTNTTAFPLGLFVYFEVVVCCFLGLVFFRFAPPGGIVALSLVIGEPGVTSFRILLDFCVIDEFFVACCGSPILVVAIAMWSLGFQINYLCTQSDP
jgi:hypothetical protein